MKADRGREAAGRPGARELWRLLKSQEDGYVPPCQHCHDRKPKINTSLVSVGLVDEAMTLLTNDAKEVQADIYYSKEKPPENPEEYRRLHFHYQHFSFVDHVWGPLGGQGSGHSSSAPETREIATSYGQVEMNEEHNVAQKPIHDTLFLSKSHHQNNVSLD